MNDIEYQNLPKCPVETTLLFLKDRECIILLGYILLGVLESSELQKMTAMSDISKNFGYFMEKRINHL